MTPREARTARPRADETDDALAQVLSGRAPRGQADRGPATGEAAPAVVVPRRMAPSEPAHLLERVLHTLDRLVRASVADRLAAAVSHLAPGLDAAGWWIGHADRSGALVRVGSGVRRVGPGGDRLDEVLARPAQTWVDPAVLAMLEGSSLSVWTGDDGSLERVLRSWGGDAVTAVAAGGYDVDAVQWTVVLVGDGASPDLRDAQTVVLAAVQASLGFPRTPVG